MTRPPALCRLILLASLVLSLPVQAQLSGSDNFTDNSKDPAKWGADVVSGNATLSEVNSRLEYRVTTPDGDFDEALRPWILNTARNTDAFDVIVDVFNNVSPTGSNSVSMGLVVTSLQNADDGISMELSRGGPSSDGKGFLAILRSAAAGGEVLPYTTPTSHASVTTASVRLSYNPTIQVFTAYYDATGSADGFQWESYGTFGVGASGGGSTRNSPWQLSQNLGFKVSVGGSSEGQVVVSGAVYADNFSGTSVVSAPTVTTVSPTSGPAAGGTSVTITGTNLTGATGVTIGGTAATGMTVVNATTITATTPAGTAGAKSVVVTTPGGSNSANSLFTYVTPAPSVTAITPNTGTTAGGTSVTITGTNLTGATGVTIGGTAATGITLVNATTITATTPAGTVGAKSVVVTTPGGSNSANSLFTYVTPAPTVTAITPNTGTTAGGTSVTITGTNLTGATGVTIGGTAATGMTVLNATTITATTPAGTAGAKSVVVTTPGGSNSANSLFTYVAPAPTVTGISPNTGSTTGGTNVTITGTNFTGATGVTIGGTAATGMTVVNATTITATTPAGTAGAKSVVVTTSGGSNGANTLFTYVVPAPTVSAISPTTGTTAGGTSVTITGTNLTGATGVTIGGTAATGITVVNATTITATTPAGTAGAKSVVVTTPGGSNSANTLFTYVTPAPTVTAITPNTGTTAGGTNVTITGTNFTGATGVTIGGTAATGITVVNATTITATTPAGTAGAKSVVVTTPGGSNSANTLFTYVTPAPTVTAVSPNTGTIAGGTSVTITGTDFTGATAVTFGGTAATNFTVVNPTTITATAPAHAAGIAYVLVTNAGGTNALSGYYIYVAPPMVTLSTVNLTVVATTLTINGTNFSSTSGNNTITFTPSGTGTIASANSSSLTVTGLSGLTPGALSAVVTTNGLSSGDPVQVGTVLAPVLGDPDSLDANIAEGIGHKVTATAVQPDGKTIIAGFFTSVGGVPRSFIARLNADGSLDAGFDPNVGGDVGSSVQSVVVQADGRILLAGPFSSVGGIARNYIARVHADGTLDTSFAPNVHRVTGPAIHSVVVQANGQILVGGSFTTVNGIPRSNIARMHSDGTLDASFNPNVGADGVACMAVQEDGRILLGGAFHTVGGTSREFLARVNADGTLDTSFNSPNPAGVIHSVAVQADGRILFGGSFYTVGGTPCINIARVSADGTLDTSFNPNASGGSVSSMVVQADGKILFGGAFHTVGVTPRNFLARMSADGMLDLGFDPSPRPATVLSVAVQPDGRILIGGQFTYLHPNGGSMMTTRNLFARLLNDPAMQTLSTVGTTQVVWTRSGSSPEVSQVTFEQSTNSGSTWTALGNGTRVGSTANWQLTGLSLPASVQIRARGRTTGGYFNGSSGLVEAVAAFGLLAPSVALSTPTAISTVGVTLNGTVNASGLPTTARFEYGLTTSYGVQASVTLSPADGSTVQNVSASLSNLAHGTTYHYRLSATSSAGTTSTTDSSFTTLTAVQAAASAMTAAGLTGPDAALTATPCNDGVSNLLKYAFNMNLSGPDSATLAPGGNRGLPRLTSQPNGSASIFRYEFLRRINSGLMHTPQKSSDLSNAASWTALTDTPTIIPIDAAWERVIYEESYDGTTTRRLFGRVQVALP